MSLDLEGNLVVRGTLTVTGQTSLGAGSIRNATVSSDPADIVDADKLEHLHRLTYSEESATAAASGAHVVHTVKGTSGVIRAFKAGSVVVATGNAVATVDLKKNGTTVLTAVITLDNANTVYIVETASLSVTTLAAGDVLEVVIVATIGSGALPKGVFAMVEISELPA